MGKKKLYNNKSIRLAEYDYGLSGGYFVTICVRNGDSIFGNVELGKMILNEKGMIAEQYWQDTPNHFENVVLDEYIIMPNHIHGIIIICGNSVVGQRHAFDTEKRKYEKLPIIIGSFKSAVTKEINMHFPEINFRWQTSYHDHIIRNKRALLNIQNYIISNPENWNDDLENELFRSNFSEKEMQYKLRKFYKELCGSG
jgi:putative transposase